MDILPRSQNQVEIASYVKEKIQTLDFNGPQTPEPSATSLVQNCTPAVAKTESLASLFARKKEEETKQKKKEGTYKEVRACVRCSVLIEIDAKSCEYCKCICVGISDPSVCSTCERSSPSKAGAKASSSGPTGVLGDTKNPSANPGTHREVAFGFGASEHEAAATAPTCGPLGMLGDKKNRSTQREVTFGFDTSGDEAAATASTSEPTSVMGNTKNPSTQGKFTFGFHGNGDEAAAMASSGPTSVLGDTSKIPSEIWPGEEVPKPIGVFQVPDSKVEDDNPSAASGITGGFNMPTDVSSGIGGEAPRPQDNATKLKKEAKKTPSAAPTPTRKTPSRKAKSRPKKY